MWIFPSKAEVSLRQMLQGIVVENYDSLVTERTNFACLIGQTRYSSYINHRAQKFPSPHCLCQVSPLHAVPPTPGGDQTTEWRWVKILFTNPHVPNLRQTCVQPGIQAETLYFYRVIGSHCNPQWGLNMRWCFGKTAPCREDALGCFSLSCLTGTVCWMTGRELQGAHPQQQESSPEPVIFWRLEKDVGKVIMTIS